jgi:hypothetical protein
MFYYRSMKAKSWILSLAAFGVIASHGGVAQTRGPISEETGPAICEPGDYISGIRCTGKYCDNITINCLRLRDASRVHYGVWTDWVSEEQGRRECPPNHLVAGLKCRGKYCDDIALYCVRAPRMRIYNCADTSFVSEEQDGTLWFTQGDDVAKFAKSIRCSGAYCDNMSFNVCEVSR